MNETYSPITEYGPEQTDDQLPERKFYFQETSPDDFNDFFVQEGQSSGDVRMNTDKNSPGFGKLEYHAESRNEKTGEVTYIPSSGLMRGKEENSSPQDKQDFRDYLAAMNNWNGHTTTWVQKNVETGQIIRVTKFERDETGRIISKIGTLREIPTEKLNKSEQAPQLHTPEKNPNETTGNKDNEHENKYSAIKTELATNRSETNETGAAPTKEFIEANHRTFLETGIGIEIDGIPEANQPASGKYLPSQTEHSDIPTRQERPTETQQEHLTETRPKHLTEAQSERSIQQDHPTKTTTRHALNALRKYMEAA